MSERLAGGLAALSIPNLHDAVLRSRGQGSPIRAEASGQDPARTGDDLSDHLR